VLEFYKTIGVILILLSSIFTFFLEPRSSVQDLEDYNLIASIEEVNPLLRSVNENLPTIIGCILALPLFLLATFKVKSRSGAQETSLTEKLLPDVAQKESVIKPSVTAKDKSITVKTLYTNSSDKALLRSGYLELEEAINQITIQGCLKFSNPMK